MNWIAPTEQDAPTETLEKKLWDSADQSRANSGLKVQEYSGPILGIIFLRFAEVHFAQQRAKLEKAAAKGGNGNLLRRGSRLDEPATVDYDAFGRIYEYFLGEFARTEGQKGGEFYTPSCIVRLSPKSSRPELPA